jgi:large subunit ribosomal protein L15
MSTKKRRKSSRYRGSQSARRGRSARTRGSGNQGGKGWAGTGKRGDQKNSLIVKLTGGNNYFGKDKTLRRGTPPQKLQIINLTDIGLKAASLTGKDGMVNLEGYKLLGEGELTQPLKIRASAASKSAIEKVKAAKGTLTLLNEKAEEGKEAKTEKTEEKSSAKSEKKKSS